MINVIKSVLAMAFLAVVGLGTVSAKSLTEQAAHIHAEAEPQAPARTKTAKTESGLDMMCLGLDIEEVKLMISAALEDPEFVEDAKESVDLLLYHLEGTSEGDELYKILADESATIKDYEATLGKIEESLLKRLTGEESWAFNVGQTLSDVYMKGAYGTEDEFKNALKQLQSYTADASKYLSVKEADVLKNIAQYADRGSLSNEDFLTIDGGLVNFIDLYFENV